LLKVVTLGWCQINIKDSTTAEKRRIILKFKAANPSLSSKGTSNKKHDSKDFKLLPARKLVVINIPVIDCNHCEAESF
jgi:hypothetical protein